MEDSVLTQAEVKQAEVMWNVDPPTKTRHTQFVVSHNKDGHMPDENGGRRANVSHKPRPMSRTGSILKPLFWTFKGSFDTDFTFYNHQQIHSSAIHDGKSLRSVVVAAASGCGTTLLLLSPSLSLFGLSLLGYTLRPKSRRL